MLYVTKMPHKSNKANATKFLENRYKMVVVNAPPRGWMPDCVVLEGMSLINTTPLAQHRTMLDYVCFLMRRFAKPYFIEGAKEVHIVFDCPRLNLCTPKAFEQSRRDSEHAVSPDHVHFQFSDEVPSPKPWREYLNCRGCKRKLIVYLGEALLVVARCYLSSVQKFVLAGCYDDRKCMCDTGSDVQVCSGLACNAEEADTRVWLHVVQSAGTRKLLVSPDTDVYHAPVQL